MLHIVDVDEKNTNDVFSRLSAGDFFWHDGCYFLKLKKGVPDEENDAVRLDNGHIFVFRHDTPVRKLPLNTLIKIKVKQ